MKLVHPDRIRRWDEETIQRIGIPGIVLMERAALGAVAAFEDFFEPEPQASIGIICGGGNNGGDGYAMARLFAEDEYDVQLFTTVDPSTLKGDAQTNQSICDQLGLAVQDATIERLEGASCDFWIDAVFGTGLSRKVEGAYTEIISFLNQQAAVFSIDVPSGLDAGTGHALGTMVWADATATFAAPKIGLVLEPGRSAAGELYVVEIGIPEEVQYDVGWDAEWLVEPRSLPPRPARFHKGDAGRVGVVGGEMLGAAILSADACLKSGAGLVKLSTQHATDAVTAVREVMCVESPDDWVEWADVVIVGPGLGTDVSAKDTFLSVWRTAQTIVADADALNLLAADPTLWDERDGSTVVTPHPGEMARLTGLSTDHILRYPIESAKALAKERGCIVVLKTEATVVANSDGWVAINATGNPGMATAGAGDVLTGVIAARLADGLRDPYDAICDAVCAHGGAGDRALQAHGELGVTASRIVDALSVVWRDWERE